MNFRVWFRIAIGLVSATMSITGSAAGERLRVMVETDAGGDPDDEQSLVRFLLYCNEWDVEAIIANRAEARPGENRNLERTGLGIIRRTISAYGECYPNLVKHDARYPKPGLLLSRTVPGYDNTEDGVRLIEAAVDAPDPRPIWFMNWGTDNGSATSCLKRALDKALREGDRDRYAKFKNRLRLSSADKFGEHTTNTAPAFPLWIDTFRPELDRKRWYHRFSALTATAGGFDVVRDVLTQHGPLGALYPTNTTHWQKEGDTMTFLYLVPTGMNDPEQPSWGSWSGRYGPMENAKGRRYFWANQVDAWNGVTNRDNTLSRWAEHLQNDFRARLDWCVKDFAEANHPPIVRLADGAERFARSGETIVLDASGSTDPDGQRLRFEWIHYPEPGGDGREVKIDNSQSSRATARLPDTKTSATIHFVLIATDTGTPPLTRYARVIVNARPAD